MNVPRASGTRLVHPLAGILTGYFLLCAAMLPWYLHRVAPDAVSYVTIARKYRAWDFQNAVNGYWSPLLSWLLAPLLCLGAPAEVTARVLEVAIGGGAIAAVWWLGKRMELPDRTHVWTTLCLVPAVVMYALVDTTPDLLVAGILAVYVGVVIGTDYPRSLWQGAACGLLGALAYLAKAYAFPFFLAHFLAVSVYLAVRRRTAREEVRRLAAATALGLLVFAVVAGGWASLLSRKYSRPTISTSGSYQLSLFRDGGGDLFGAGGLFPPPNATAISAWEDPTDLKRSPRPTPRKPPRPHSTQAPAKPGPGSAPSPATAPIAAAARGVGWLSAWDWSRCRELLFRVWRNLVRLLLMLVKFVWLTPIILLGLLLSSFLVPDVHVRDRCTVLLGTLLLYPSGYLPIFVHERYLWLMTFLLAVSAGLLASTLPILGREPWRTAWTIVAGGSFTLWPAWMLVSLHRHVLEATPAVANQLLDAIPPGARMASDLEWGITDSITYFLDARYYGMLPHGAPAAEQARQLLEHRIEYLVVWGDPGRYTLLESARELPLRIEWDPRFGGPPRVFAVTEAMREPVPSEQKEVGRP